MDWLIPGYVEALVKEIRCWEYGGTVDTVYLGGGTPTMLDEQHLGAILEACGHAFAVAPHAEITIEANPGTISETFLRHLRALGVNRLSLGVQSFDDRRLKELGRRHSASKALEAFGLARIAFNNVNIDLLYALPNQTLEEWHQALKKALGLEPDHISLYPLTVEEGTPLSQEIDSGKVIRPDPDLAADMFLLAETMLSDYEHYEISNWAGPGRRCRHNLTYWKNLPYLGFGAGAHSFFNHHRFSNLLSPVDYVQRLNEADSPTEQEEDIGEALEMAETMILGLRLREGVNLAEFSNRFNRDAASVYGDEIDELVSLGLILNDGSTIRLTNRGKLLGNQVFLRFLP